MIRTMGEMDREKERRRLAAYYASLDDAELGKIAAESAELTEIAREALRAEISRRSMVPEIFHPASSLKTDPPAAPAIIRRYRDLPEALIARSVLDSAGIECFLIDENIVRLNWFLSNLVGNVKVLVRAEEAAEGSLILAQPVPESFATDTETEYVQPRCPKCQSFEVTLNGLDRRFFLALLISLPLTVTIKGWSCRTCRHEWPERLDG